MVSAQATDEDPCFSDRAVIADDPEKILVHEGPYGTPEILRLF